MIEDDLQKKLERLEASVENKTADGALLEELVEQCAGDIPDWEVSDCWPLGDYPGLLELGLDPYDDGIDLIAEKTDGSRVAIQCKALSDGNVTTTMIQKFAGKANRFDERWLVTTAQQTVTNARTLQECNVVWKDALAELPQALLAHDEPREDSADPRTAMQDEAVAECIKSLKNPPPELLAQWREEGSGARGSPRGLLPLVVPREAGQHRLSSRLLPGGNQVRMHIVAGRQLRHRRFLAKRLQRDLRLQLSRITPSLPWHSRLLLLGLDPTLASCPNSRVHLFRAGQTACGAAAGTLPSGKRVRARGG